MQLMVVCDNDCKTLTVGVCHCFIGNDAIVHSDDEFGIRMCLQNVVHSVDAEAKTVNGPVIAVIAHITTNSTKALDCNGTGTTSVSVIILIDNNFLMLSQGTFEGSDSLVKILKAGIGHNGRK